MGLRTSESGHERGRCASLHPDRVLRDLLLLDAEIGRDHPGIVANLIRRAVCDLLAVVEHDDVVGNLHHHGHVVLDQKDRGRMLVPDLVQIAAELGALIRIEAGGRLVETKQHRVRAHGARDLQPALAAIRQFAGGIVGAVGEGGAVEPIARLVDRGALRPCVGAQSKRAEHGKSGRPHQGIVLGDQKILQHSHALEQADVLKRARDAGPVRHQIVGHALEQKQNAVPARDAARAALGQGAELFPHAGITELQRDASLARLVEAGDAVEHRRLAGAVRPDQRGDIAASGREREIVDGHQAAEAHAEVLDAQQWREVRGSSRLAWARTVRRSVVACNAHPWRSRTSEGCVPLPCGSRKKGARRAWSNVEGSRVAIRPRGRQTMISTIAKPNSSMRYWVGSKSLPNIALRKSSSRMISVPPIMMTAAIATPMRLPMPPSTTMATITADSMKVKLSGEMNPCRAAKNDPAKPANIAPVAKAVSLVLVVLMPSERQAISSSRRASHARPIGNRRSRTVMAAVIRARARIR